MCDVPPEREGAPRITPPLHHWETGVCSLGQAVQHQLQPPDVVRNTSNTRENTPSARWVGANMAAFCDLLIQNGYHLKCSACSETSPERLLVSLWAGLVTEPKWRPCRDPGTSQGWTILVFLRNMNRWLIVYCLKLDSFKKTYTLLPWIFLSLLLHSVSPISGHFSENGEWKRNPLSVATWKINLDRVVQSTHLNVSHVKLPENRNDSTRLIVCFVV